LQIQESRFVVPEPDCGAIERELESIQKDIDAVGFTLYSIDPEL
jgi:hypothetical protein